MVDISNDGFIIIATSARPLTHVYDGIRPNLMKP